MFKKSDARTMLEKSLLDAVNLFGENAAAWNVHLDRHLAAAVADFDRVTPLIEGAQIQLLPDVPNYAAAARAIRFHSSEVVDRNLELDPWNPLRLAEVPTPSIARISGQKAWQFRPIPTEYVISRIGSIYPFTYVAAHVLSDTEAETTLDARDLPLLVLRAQVEALRELAVRNAHKPVALRDGVYSQTRNATPAALAAEFMMLWEQQMRPSAEIYGTMPRLRR